jgi:hypothetical protein
LLTKKELKKAIVAEIPRLYAALGSKLKDVEIIDLGLAGFSISTTIRHPKVEVLTVSTPILLNSTIEEVKAEVDHLIETINDPSLEEKIAVANAASAITGANEVFGNDIPGVAMAEVFERFAKLGITLDEVFFLAEQAQIDPKLFQRLNDFLDNGAKDDFKDILGKSGKPGKRSQ